MAVYEFFAARLPYEFEKINSIARSIIINHNVWIPIPNPVPQQNV
jgi:hypothetical protein